MKKKKKQQQQIKYAHKIVNFPFCYPERNVR